MLTPDEPPPRRTRPVLSVLLVFAGFVALVAVFGGRNDRVVADQDLFHLPVIRQFAAQWPRPDLTNYASATAPGYHLLLAAVARYASGEVAVLRCVGGLFGLAFIGLLAFASARRSAWLALPAAASVYVLSSTVWLLPEDAAWALVTLALLLAMRASGRTLFLGSAVTLATLVFVRQSHAWAFAPFAAGAYSLSRYPGRGRGRGSADFRTTDSSAADPLPNPLPDYRERGPDVRLFIAIALAILPAVLVLAGLVALWHGLTPPAFRPGSGIDLPMATKVGGVAPAAAAMVLALVGLFGTPLLAWFWPADRPRRAARVAVLGAAVGFVIGAAPVTTYSFARRSGIWNLVHALPTFADRSPVMVVLAALGGGVAAIALYRLPPRERRVLAAALAGFTLTQTATALVWQRYYEPFVLLWLVLAAGVATPESLSPTRRRLRTGGLIALTAFQLAVTAYTLRG